MQSAPGSPLPVAFLQQQLQKKKRDVPNAEILAAILEAWLLTKDEKDLQAMLPDNAAKGPPH
eukprot:5813118-Prorocentrum_lima.AAC.1